MGAKAYPGGQVTGTLKKKAAVKKTTRQKAGPSVNKNSAPTSKTSTKPK